MKIRSPLIALGLALAATTAFAAAPQAASASKTAAPAKTIKHHRTCEQRSKMGKCEKWSDAKQDATAAAKKS